MPFECCGQPVKKLMKGLRCEACGREVLGTDSYAADAEWERQDTIIAGRQLAKERGVKFRPPSNLKDEYSMPHLRFKYLDGR